MKKLVSLITAPVLILKGNSMNSHCDTRKSRWSNCGY